MLDKLVNLNTLADGPVFEVPPGAGLAVVRVSSLLSSSWSNAALEVAGQVGSCGGFRPLATPVAVASTDDGDALGPFNVAGLSAIMIRPTAVETAGGSATPVYAVVEVTMLQAAMNVSL